MKLKIEGIKSNMKSGIIDKNLNKWLKVSATILIFAIWFIILMKSFSALCLNSDMAGMVIEANEILS